MPRGQQGDSAQHSAPDSPLTGLPVCRSTEQRSVCHTSSPNRFHLSNQEGRNQYSERGVLITGADVSAQRH